MNLHSRRSPAPIGNLFNGQLLRQVQTKLSARIEISGARISLARKCEVEMATTALLARKRILCVEDDEDNRDMMSVLLDHYGYEAVIAASVSDALERARSGGLALCILDHWLTESN